ncbi:membrane protease YdiL (CAAX protease family) [Inhella inkyongensis]|uniref:Membrane protease YdiL (CAAX protease family) n=1 Tax=Inhella inkyongensis TaxID=392593 RepID=A0A840SDE5_9BURK|nr:CPBP family intramembrane glutamic endopeptidase [Inhella inkyongensis]MBB5206319.1 membrane protease YdiL (CAAX protease family) [Inhella inkyongensis]
MHRRQIGPALFFLIAFGIPWAGWTVWRDQGLPFWLTPLAVSLAAFVAAGVERGPAGLRRFALRVLRMQIPLPVWVTALLLPLTLGLSFLLTHGVSLALLQPQFAPNLGGMLAMGLVTGPLAEEFGWRGYLQSRLLASQRPITVAALVGLVWCTWHWPLFHTSVFQSLPSTLHFAAFCITWSVFLLYLVEHSGGSVWPAVLLHATLNSHSSLLGMLFPGLDRALLPGGSQSTFFYAGAAAAFVLWKRHYFFGRPKKV